MSTSELTRLIVVHSHVQMGWQRQWVEGVQRYIQRAQVHWRLLFTPQMGEPDDQRLLEAEDADGVVSLLPIGDPHVRQALADRDIPIVFSEIDLSGECRILSDCERVGRLAAEHLIEKGLRHFSFYSEYHVPPFLQREEAFAQAVSQAGLEFHHADYPKPRPGIFHPDRRRETAHWLEPMPRPLGVFAGNAEGALHLVAACNAMDISVPDQVAIVCCDNDELLCNMAHPPLSAIDHGMIENGYAAAETLDALMRGRAVDEVRTIAPAGVVERQSSDTLAVQSRHVRGALVYIRENFPEGISASDVAAHVQAARRKLEIDFRRLLGKTIQQEIVHQRIRHAMHLLTETDLTMTEIAVDCGFSTTAMLHTAFRKAMGETPGSYREKYATEEA